MITGFRREVSESCALLGYYAAREVVILFLRNRHYSLHNNREERSS